MGKEGGPVRKGDRGARKRVLFAITSGETGGAQEHVRQLTAGLLARGHEVGGIVRDPPDLAITARPLGAAVFDWPSICRNPHPMADIRARRELAHAVQTFG